MILADKFAEALWNYGVRWLSDPDNRDKIDAAAAYLIDKFTDATPWAWDDKILDSFSVKVTAKIIEQLISQIPILGGRL